MIRCKAPPDPEQRPACLVTVSIDEVSVETAADARTLATWSAAGRETPDR